MADLAVEKLEGEIDAALLGTILCQCFQASDAFWPEYRQRLGDDAFRVVRRDGRVVGGLAVLSMGQWFGGHSVPMAGIAAVGIAPEARGGGAAKTLMSEVLRELRSEGFALSVLYSAAQALYRSVGYEMAGTRCVFEVDCAAIGIRDRELPVTRIDPTDCDALLDLDRRRSSAGCGLLDRGGAIWHQVTKTREGRVHGYLVGDEQDPVGYVLFRQVTPKGGGDYDVEVRDLVALTPAANRRIWSLLADQRSQAGRTVWTGPASDPALLLFPEPAHRVRTLERWHLRVLDVESALAARGYPRGRPQEVCLRVHDDLLPENDGHWILHVREGEGRVESGGNSAIRLDARGLAPLYTGLLSPRALASIGLLESDEESLVAAERVFAGPEPWMPDAF